MPKQASIEQLPRPATATDFAAAVESADIIYFPTERAASGARSEPAAVLLEALEKTAKPFAVGWEMIYESQQPLLDQLETATGSAREKLIAQLDLVANGRAREHCRAVLREMPMPGVHHLALRLPMELTIKVSAGEKLSSDEEKLLPRGFSAPSGGAASYAARNGGGNLGDPNLVRAYRAELVREEFAAAIIVRYLRAGGNGHKFVIFSGVDDLDSDNGLPYFVAQRTNARQLVLGPNIPKKERPKVLTQLRRGFEIVDCSPISGSY